MASWFAVRACGVRATSPHPGRNRAIAFAVRPLLVQQRIAVAPTSTAASDAACVRAAVIRSAAESQCSRWIRPRRAAHWRYEASASARSAIAAIVVTTASGS